MQLPELCIRRPVMTTLLMAAFVIFGMISYTALPVSEDLATRILALPIHPYLTEADIDRVASAIRAAL